MIPLKFLPFGPIPLFFLVFFPFVGPARSDDSSSKESQKLFLKAVHELKAERWAVAKKDFKKVLGKDPGNLKAHFYLGEAEYYTHHLPEAEAYFRWVDSRAPSTPVNHYYLGRVEYDSKQYDQALMELETANRLDNHISLLHYYLGLIHYKKKDLQSAQREFHQAIELDPLSPKAHYSLAYLLYHDLNRPSDAWVEAQEALKEKPDQELKIKIMRLQKQIKK